MTSDNERSALWIELAGLNLIALLSLVIPTVIFLIDPWGIGDIGIIIAAILWLLPGGNVGCIHMFVGGYMPFIISYPFVLYHLLEHENMVEVN